MTGAQFMPWRISWRAQRAAAALADRHYNRQSPGHRQFVPPGGCCALLSACAQAVWVTSTPLPQYVKHEWPDAWVNTLFRNEGSDLSSSLITAAVAASLAVLGDPPPRGIVTFVDRTKVRPKRDPGYCYLMAGWKRVGKTKGGLIAWQQLPADMPDPQRPLEWQPDLLGNVA